MPFRMRSPPTAPRSCTTTRRRSTTPPGRRRCPPRAPSSDRWFARRLPGRTLRRGSTGTTRARSSTCRSAASCPPDRTCWRRSSRLFASRPLRVALAIGSAPAAAIGPTPADWLVRTYLPQVAILEHASVAVTHAGNNSVTEALTAGVPLVALPFSTDQFAGAASIERAGLGLALDPNSVTAHAIDAAVADVSSPALPLGGCRPARRVAGGPGSRPGPAGGRRAQPGGPSRSVTWSPRRTRPGRTTSASTPKST